VEQRSIDDAEDRRISTDAQRQSTLHCKRKAGTPAKSPYGELEVLKYALEHKNPSSIYESRSATMTSHRNRR
jgi:hypothetical protein